MNSFQNEKERKYFIKSKIAKESLKKSHSSFWTLMCLGQCNEEGKCFKEQLCIDFIQ